MLYTLELGCSYLENLHTYNIPISVSYVFITYRICQKSRQAMGVEIPRGVQKPGSSRKRGDPRSYRYTKRDEDSNGRRGHKEASRHQANCEEQTKGVEAGMRRDT